MAKFGEVTNYLGMTFEYRNGEVHITMFGYKQSLVKDWIDIGANSIFENRESKLLDPVNAGILKTTNSYYVV